MDEGYSRGRASRYNTVWHRFEQRTLAAAQAMIDRDALCDEQLRQRGSVRILDAACGTGLLLRQLLRDGLPTCLAHRDVEVYGIDASAHMLAQAQVALRDWPRAHLERAVLGTGETANLPFALGTFDLITCTNALHYLPDPVASLMGLGRLLAPGGQLVLEDYARRAPPFPWSAFEWLIRRVDHQHVRAYTLEEVVVCCTQAGLAVTKRVSEQIWEVRSRIACPLPLIPKPWPRFRRLQHRAPTDGHAQPARLRSAIG